LVFELGVLALVLGVVELVVGVGEEEGVAHVGSDVLQCDEDCVEGAVVLCVY
jgi:hypothetical protein